MAFFDWLEQQNIPMRRIRRGAKVWKYFFSLNFWRRFIVKMPIFLCFVILSVWWVPTYLLGLSAEWLQDRREGIKTVRR